MVMAMVKKPANPVICEGYGKRNCFPKKKDDKDKVPDSNRVVPGMPNAIKSKGGDGKGSLLITDNDLRFDNSTNPASQYTTAQQIVMAGRPVTWSMSSSSQTAVRSNLTEQSAIASGRSINPSITTDVDFDGYKYDPNNASRNDTSKNRVNKLLTGVNDAVQGVKAPVEAQQFERNAEETRNLAFSAVPFLPWEASKIMPIDRFDGSKPYVPTKVDSILTNDIQKASIVDDHSVLQNPAINKQFKNFNRTACGFGHW